MAYPKRGISIDVGHDKIKIAEYNRNKDKVNVKNSILIDTPDNSVADGQISDIESVSGVIKDVLSEKKMKSRNVIFSVSSSKIITREVDLPNLPKKKLDTLIKMNAEEYFPVNLDEYTLDYSISEKVADKDGELLKVNIIAALTVMIESYVELAKTLKLKVSGIDYSGNSIINFAKHIAEERAYMLLDLGSDSTMVTIMNQGIVRFNRNLVYGTKVISNSIQNHFGVSYEEALKISIEQQLLNSTPEGNDYLSNDVSSALNQILNGVSRLVDYYTSRNKDGIDRIILVGGGTRILGISDYVENYFNIKTKILERDDTVNITGTEIFENNRVFYANAMGSIYSDINLMPLSLTSKSKEKAANRLRLELAALLVLMLGVAMYLPYNNIKNLEEEKAQLERDIALKKDVEPVILQYNQVIADLNFHENLILSSSSTSENVVDIFELMESAVPEEINYTALANNEEGMLISCSTIDKLTIINFVQSLRKLEIDGTKVFRYVYIPAITEVTKVGSEDVEYTFSISCIYDKEVQ